MTNQTNKRKSFIIHKDSLSVLKKLSDEKAGKLFKAIFEYQQNKKLPDDEFVSIIFEPFFNQFLRDEEKWERVREARIDAGSKGGKQKVANASKSKQKVANLAVSVSDSVSVSVNVSKKELPIFINKNLFDAFAETRKKLKKPLTEKAQELIIKKLSEFEAKQAGSANKALENSIENSWQGVFEPKPNQSSQSLEVNKWSKY